MSDIAIGSVWRKIPDPGIWGEEAGHIVVVTKIEHSSYIYYRHPYPNGVFFSHGETKRFRSDFLSKFELIEE